MISLRLGVKDVLQLETNNTNTKKKKKKKTKNEIFGDNIKNNKGRSNNWDALDTVAT